MTPTIFRSSQSNPPDETVTIYDAGLDIERIPVELDRFPFRDWFMQVCGTTDLEALHEHVDANAENYRKKFAELQARAIAQIDALSDLVATFIAEVLEPIYGKVSNFQTTPTTRFHFAVNAPGLRCEEDLYRTQGPEALLRTFYHDRPALFHRDKDYGLVPGSMNLWVPVTPAVGTGALWIGSKRQYGKDALPATIYPGEALCFDGAGRWHGAVWNTSGITRISFDVRLWFEAGPWRTNQPKIPSAGEIPPSGLHEKESLDQLLQAR